jgi:anti-sigma B factor antagonist
VKVEVDQPKTIRRISLDGRLDADSVKQAEAEFNVAVASGPNVIVDLSKVGFIASLGIRMLVAASQKQSELGGKLVLVGPDEMTMRILKTTGIDQLIPVRASLNEAVALF